MNYKKIVLLMSFICAVPVSGMQRDHGIKRLQEDQCHDIPLFEQEPEKKVKVNSVGGSALIKKMHGFYKKEHDSYLHRKESAKFLDELCQVAYPGQSYEALSHQVEQTEKPHIPSIVHKGIYPGVAKAMEIMGKELPSKTDKNQCIEYHPISEPRNTLAGDPVKRSVGSLFLEPISAAVKENDLERVQLLCKPQYHFPEIIAVAADRVNNALGWACDFGNLDAVKLLIESCGADVQFQDAYGNTLMHIACHQGHLPVVQYLIERCKVDANQGNQKQGMTALHYACRKGHLPVVQYLIEQSKVDANQVNQKNGDTGLHHACGYGQLPVVQYLIEDCKVDANQVNQKSGDTALYYACRKGHLPVAQYLIEQCKVDTNQVNQKNGIAALHAACAHGQLPVVQYLIEDCKVNANQVNQKSGDIGLHLACWNGHLPVAQYLIDECKVALRVKVKNESSVYSLAVRGSSSENKDIANRCKSVMLYLQKHILTEHSGVNENPTCPICFDKITVQRIEGQEMDVTECCMQLICKNCKASLEKERKSCALCGNKKF